MILNYRMQGCNITLEQEVARILSQAVKELLVLFLKNVSAL